MTAPATTLPPVLTFEYAPKPGVRRTLKAHTPDEGILAVWGASAGRFQSLGAEWADAELALEGKPDDDPEVVQFRTTRAQQAQRALDRTLKIIKSALVDEADYDWVEDALLERKINLNDALGIITGAVDALKKHRAEQGPPAPKNGPTRARRV